MLKSKQPGPVYLTISCVLLEITGAAWELIKNKPVKYKDTVMKTYFTTSATKFLVGFSAKTPAEKPEHKPPKMFAKKCPEIAEIPENVLIEVPQKPTAITPGQWKEFLVGELARKLVQAVSAEKLPASRQIEKRLIAAEKNSYHAGWDDQKRAVSSYWAKRGANPAAFILEPAQVYVAKKATTDESPEWAEYWLSAENGDPNMKKLDKPFIYF